MGGVGWSEYPSPCAISLSLFFFWVLKGPKSIFHTFFLKTRSKHVSSFSKKNHNFRFIVLCNFWEIPIPKHNILAFVFFFFAGICVSFFASGSKSTSGAGVMAHQGVAARSRRPRRWRPGTRLRPRPAAIRRTPSGSSPAPRQRTCGGWRFRHCLTFSGWVGQPPTNFQKLFILYPPHHHPTPTNILSPPPAKKPFVFAPTPPHHRKRTNLFLPPQRPNNCVLPGWVGVPADVES